MPPSYLNQTLQAQTPEEIAQAGMAIIVFAGMIFFLITAVEIWGHLQRRIWVNDKELKEALGMFLSGVATILMYGIYLVVNSKEISQEISQEIAGNREPPTNQEWAVPIFWIGIMVIVIIVITMTHNSKEKPED